MTTLKQIFSYPLKSLDNILKQYKDETKYNNLETINAVIIHLFNDNKLNDEDSKIVESDEYDLVMKLNPKNYEKFITNYNKLKNKNKFKRVNITADTSIFKSWKTPKVTTLEGHEDSVNNILIFNKMIDKNNSIDYLISCSNDRTIKIWNLKNFEYIRTLEAHTDWINNIITYNKIIDQNNSIDYLISSSYDKTIKIWNLQTFEFITSLTGHTNVIKNIITFNKMIDENNSIDYLISCSYDSTIKIWDLRNFEYITTLKGHQDWVTNIIIKSNNTFHSTNHKIIKSHKMINKNNSIDYLISCSCDYTIKIWNLQTFECIETLEGHESWVTNIITYKKIIDKNNSIDYLISCSNDKTIKIWDLKTFKCVATLKGHKYGVTNILIFNKMIDKNTSIDYLISCSYDSTIKIWNLKNFEFIATLEGHTDTIRNIIIKSTSTFDSVNHKIIDSDKMIDKNNNVDYLISCSYDGTIKIWNLKTFDCIAILEEHTDWINNIITYKKIIDKNNSIDYLISCSYDKTIKIWEKD